MKQFRVHRRTAIVGVNIFDLGPMADALAEHLGRTMPPLTPRTDSQVDTERLYYQEHLYHQVTSLIAAMSEFTETESDEID